MSFFLRFLVCALVVVGTSVLAAFAWDHSDAVTAQAAAEQPGSRSGPAPGR